MCDNMVYEEKVIGIVITGKVVWYYFGDDETLESSSELGKIWDWTVEGEVFATKAELIKSL